MDTGGIGRAKPMSGVRISVMPDAMSALLTPQSDATMPHTHAPIAMPPVSEA